MAKKHNNIMMIIIIIAIGLSATIAYVNMTKPEKPVGLQSVNKDETVWVKCKDPDCNSEYEMSKVVYLVSLEQAVDPMVIKPQAVTCKKCGNNTAYRALVCEGCSTTFFYAEVSGDFVDRCPGCGFSKTEQQRKNAAK